MAAEIKLTLTFFEAVEVAAALEAYVKHLPKSADASARDAGAVLARLGVQVPSRKEKQARR